VLDIRGPCAYILVGVGILSRRTVMIQTLNALEMETLIDVLHERLDNVRRELLDAEDYDDKQGFRQTEETLRRLIGKLEKERIVAPAAG